MTSPALTGALTVIFEAALTIRPPRSFGTERSVLTGRTPIAPPLMRTVVVTILSGWNISLAA